MFEDVGGHSAGLVGPTIMVTKEGRRSDTGPVTSAISNLLSVDAIVSASIVSAKSIFKESIVLSKASCYKKNTKLTVLSDASFFSSDPISAGNLLFRYNSYLIWIMIVH
jgi:hypothetical protein